MSIFKVGRGVPRLKTNGHRQLVMYSGLPSAPRYLSHVLAHTAGPNQSRTKPPSGGEAPGTEDVHGTKTCPGSHRRHCSYTGLREHSSQGEGRGGPVERGVQKG